MSFADEVRAGLLATGQKTLPTKYLYDDVGSALFDAITALQEYGLTRADFRLLQTHAEDIARLCPATTQLAELGSGNGSKTRAIMHAFGRDTIYRPIDLSRAALDSCRRELADFSVAPVEADFITGLKLVAEARDAGGMLVALLGSNIGNFSRPSVVPFLSEIRACLMPGDTFLLGADLVKSPEQLLLAYDDPAGVTAAFNRNLLARVNRQLEGNFSLRCFDHEARWNESERRIEMHLRSRCPQEIRLKAIDLEVAFDVDETIWTESSHKFEVPELIEMAGDAGFTIAEYWQDSEWAFAEMLFRV